MRLHYLFTGLMLLSACHHVRPTAAEASTPLASQPPQPEVPKTVLPPVEIAKSLRADSVIHIDPPSIDIISETNAELQDVFYAYNQADLTEAASAALQHDAEVLAAILARFPHLKVRVEGHCDERGSAEYNLALGDTRARRASETLRQLGLLAHLETVSYGKENPQCNESTESCWQKNRRAHIAVSTTAGLP